MIIAKLIDGDYGMIRGTTPVNVFNVNIDLTTAEVIYITYKQAGKTVIEKNINDITVATGSLTVTLQQSDTLRLAANDVEIQIRARFPNGTAIASNIITTPVMNILKDGVI